MARLRRRTLPLLVATALIAVTGIAGLGLWRLDAGGPTAVPPAPGAAAARGEVAITGGGAHPPVDALAQRSPGSGAGFARAFASGLEHLRRGDAHGAALAFDAARRADPRVPEAHLNLGFAFLELGQPAEARRLFEHTIDLAPGMPNAYYGLAEALEALGDIPGARGAMRTFLHLAAADDPFRRRAMAALWEWEQPVDSALRVPREDDESAGRRVRPALAPAPERPARAGSAGAAHGAPGEGEGVADPADTPVLAPLFTAPLQTLDGAPATLSGHAGKVVVLNIWAVWCGPCRQELPSLERLAAALDPGRFAVVGVSIDRRAAFARELLAELGITFANYHDHAKELTGAILPASIIPLTAIIGPGGEILARYEGARDWSAPAIVAAIRQLADEAVPAGARRAALERALGQGGRG